MNLKLWKSSDRDIVAYIHLTPGVVHSHIKHTMSTWTTTTTVIRTTIPSSYLLSVGARPFPFLTHAQTQLVFALCRLVFVLCVPAYCVNNNNNEELEATLKKLEPSFWRAGDIRIRESAKAAMRSKVGNRIFVFSETGLSTDWHWI